MSEKIKRSEGSYQKEIIVDEQKSGVTVIREQKGGYYVFEIPLNTKITFHLKVLKASNMEATGQNVYWVAQAHKHFKTNKWLQFQKVNNSGATRFVENEKPLHQFLNHLNKGTKYEKRFLEDGSANPDYKNYTEESTKGVGKNYIPANPYKDRFTKRADENLYGDLNYTATKLGEGIWLEGFNFTPEHASQGAFVLAVAEPQILSFFVEKRYQQERKVRRQGITTEKQQDTTHVAQDLIYGDYMDLHLRLHNVFGYIAHIEVFCGDKSMDESTEGCMYVKTISLFDKKSDDTPSLSENPSLYYNLDIIDELLTDFRWANISKHKPGKDTEDSLQEYTMVLTLTPTEASKKQGNPKPVLKREVTFTVNYKGDFSLEEQEHKYVAQIIKVKQPPIVTQSYETCKYTRLTLTVGDQSPFDLLREEDDGSLSGLCADNKTPVYELVAGNVANVVPVTIDIDADVSTCDDSTLNHQNNTFNTDNIVALVYEKGEGFWESLKNKNIFPEVQPYTQDGEITENQLKFKAAYPYQAWSEDTFLFKYLTWQIDPVELHIGVRSCRYERTPSFYIYPDMVWALHFNYGIKEEDILYFQNKEVGLVSGYAQYMDYIKDAVLWIYEPFKEYFDYFFPKGNQEKLEEIIEELGLDDDRTYARLGFHVGYDGDKEINYTDLTKYKAYMYYMIYQMVMISLGIDLLILYITRGRALKGKALKLQRVLKKVKKTTDSIEKATGLEFSILYPKINANAGTYRIPMKNGEIATIIEATIQAKPLIGLNVKYEYDFNEKKGISLIDKDGKKHKVKKFNWLKDLKATFELDDHINVDVNIKYNTNTGMFEINDNGMHQNMHSGDILKTENAIIGNAQLKGEVVLPLYKGSNSVSLHVLASAKTEFGFSEAKILGTDEIGPYFRIQYIIEEFYLDINVDVVAKKGRKTLWDIKKAIKDFFGIENQDDHDFKKIFFEEKKITFDKMYLFDPLRKYKDKIQK